MIGSKKLSDNQCLGVLRILRKHWPTGIPAYIPAALKFRKRSLDHLYTKVDSFHMSCHTGQILKFLVTLITQCQVFLDENTDLHFTDKEGNILPR